MLDSLIYGLADSNTFIMLLGLHERVAWPLTAF